MNRRLVIATKNSHKLAEIQEMLSDLAVEVVSLKEYGDVPDVIEDGETFTANAIKKARQVGEFTKEWTLADDSGLEVMALAGRPGVYSARFAGEPADDKRNNEKLLELLADVPQEQRQARFCCVVALANPEGEVVTFEGVCQGHIGFEPRGFGGFGYDPLFVVDDYGKTFAELGEEIKNKISHRARALAELKTYLAHKKIK